MNPVSLLKLVTLGGAEIYLDGQQIPGLKSAKARALVFYLAATGKIVSREQAAALLWSEMPETKARDNLRQALRQLRRFLPDHVEITRETIGLRKGAAVELDSALFEREATAGLEGRAETERLEAAVARYAGDFLAGFCLPGAPEFDEWVLGVSEQLRGTALHALHTLSEWHAARRNTAAGLRYTRRLLQMEPWREESHRQMMRLLAWDGQTGAALAQYKRCREILAAELGVTPMESTTALFERIRRLREGGISNLPAERTLFVGREAELAELAAWLAQPDTRLVCITGVGGAGKTRLARRAAQMQQRHYLDGVFLVLLAGVNGAAHIPGAIAEAAGLALPGRRPAEEELLQALADKEMLLLLDNFEHLPAGVPLLAKILAAAPGVTLLVTSRERLNMRCEQVFPLAGLPGPEAGDSGATTDSAAARLFERMARRARPDFSLEDEWEGTAAICARVGGLPLALELAASWTAVYDCAAIAERIAANLDFLANRYRDAPKRHSSLLTVLAGSWQMLAPQEQKWLARLSVFRGQFTTDAALAATQADEAGLQGLADKSLLARAGRNSFSLHPLVQQFARERLEEMQAADAAHLAHQRYYLRFLREQTGLARGEAIGRAASRLREAHENMLAAWEYAAARKDAAALEDFCAPLARFYTLTNLFEEGERVFRKTAASLPERAANAARLRAKLAAYAALLAVRQGRYKAASAAAQQALAQDTAVIGEETAGYALLAWGEALWRRQRYAEAQPKLEEAADLFRAAGSGEGQAAVQRQLGIVCYEQGRLNQGRPALEAALSLFREQEDLPGEGAVLNNLAILENYAGNVGETQMELLQASLEISRQTGNLWGESIVLSNLGHNYLRLGQYQTAADYHRQALRLRRELGNPDRIASSLRNLGVTAARQGMAEEGLVLLAQSSQAARQGGGRMAEALTQLQRGHILTGLGRLAAAEEAFEAALGPVEAASASGYLLEIEAGLIRLALARNETAEAGRRAAALHACLPEKLLKTADEPEFILLACYQGLAAADDARAAAALERARVMQQTLLGAIRSDRLRQSFLQTPYIREIENAWRRMGEGARG